MKKFFKSAWQGLKSAKEKFTEHIKGYNAYAVLTVAGMGCISTSAFLTDIRLGFLATGLELILLAYFIYKQTD